MKASKSRRNISNLVEALKMRWKLSSRASESRGRRDLFCPFPPSAAGLTLDCAGKANRVPSLVVAGPLVSAESRGPTRFSGPEPLADGRKSRVGAGPIIWRELRAEARNSSNYWLRWIGATVLAAVFGMLLRDRNVVSAVFSIRLFTATHTVLLVAIWMVGPVLTADAISRERREGTLSLLFGANLPPRSIVLGKGFVRMARLATLWLAAFPVLTVALLLGGVTRLDVLSAFVIEFSAGLWALGVGLVVSSFVQNPIAAVLLAEISVAALGIFCSGFSDGPGSIS